MDELSIIERFLRPLAGPGAFELRDDAARLLPPEGSELVVTCDMVAAGVHFLPDDPPDTIAQKALRVNLSDLAAKGARPLAYVLGLGLPERSSEDWLAGFAAGLRRDGNAFGIALIGGDTIAVAAGPVFSVTAFGAVPAGRMVHRFTGQPGDSLYVSGAIGAATVGLAFLKGEAGPWDSMTPERRAELVRSFQVPEPRVGLASALRDFARAAMDVSDGLVGDCDKLAAASGCRAVIDAARVPAPAELMGEAALVARLITAGDDYEILAAVAPERESGFRSAAAAAGIPVSRIGALAAGTGPTEVRWQGGELPLAGRAWVHGRNEATA